ncbi:DUF4373 domain-containing protein [Streptococcus agalactiae]|uniref:Lin1244/Lin1753 domain-containing protein n=1 Tax=Streptococcus agalactiae TaxID=1311 RepID=UPI002555C528|nr:Lin1244/Lin1753 domain-containing protein [Streptococcus agalactiae]MDK8747554.1 DUF4373 domain-containing protein [Streptococcus agalactiae]
MAKDAYYFSHDSNARYDPKILAMRSEYGLEGYGLYWVFIEILREQQEYKLKKYKHLFSALAMQMHINVDATKKFIEDCIYEFELLQEDEDFIWCESLMKRMQIKDEKSEKAKKAAEARWNKPRNNKESLENQSNLNTNVMQLHSYSKANKEKENKEKENKSLKDYTSQIKNLLSRYPEAFSELNKVYWNVIRETRSSGKVQQSVIYKSMEKWSQYPIKVVEFALKTHIELGNDKDEKYTIGIMRRTTNDEAIDKLDRMGPKGVMKRESNIYDNIF